MTTSSREVDDDSQHSSIAKRTWRRIRAVHDALNQGPFRCPFRTIGMGVGMLLGVRWGAGFSFVVWTNIEHSLQRPATSTTFDYALPFIVGGALICSTIFSIVGWKIGARLSLIQNWTVTRGAFVSATIATIVVIFYSLSVLGFLLATVGLKFAWDLVLNDFPIWFPKLLGLSVFLVVCCAALGGFKAKQHKKKMEDSTSKEDMNKIR